MFRASKGPLDVAADAVVVRRLAGALAEAAVGGQPFKFIPK